MPRVTHIIRLLHAQPDLRFTPKKRNKENENSLPCSQYIAMPFLGHSGTNYSMYGNEINLHNPHRQV